MLSYVVMKILESRPRSYDRRMEAVSGGEVGAIKRAVAEVVASEACSRALEIGCGTGELSVMIAAGGVRVDAFDRSEAMVEVASERVQALGEDDPTRRVTFTVMGVEGMDRLEGGVYDTVVSTLVFSELSDGERRYALEHTRRVLAPGGLFVVADEVVPRTALRRVAHALARTPAAAATFLVSRATTRPLTDLAGEVSAAGLEVVREDRSRGDTLALVVARTPADSE